jgi:hypothetical protein
VRNRRLSIRASVSGIRRSPFAYPRQHAHYSPIRASVRGILHTTRPAPAICDRDALSPQSISKIETTYTRNAMEESKNPDTAPAYADCADAPAAPDGASDPVVAIPLSSLSPQAVQWLVQNPPEFAVAALESGIAGAILFAAAKPHRTPARVGADAEARLERALRRYYADVRNVAHEAESADLQVMSQVGIILIESKSYTGPVPTSGVEKFRRDIESCQPAAAVMVSQTAITGVAPNGSNLQYECVAGKIVPTLYVVCADADSAAAVVRAFECALAGASGTPGAASGQSPRDCGHDSERISEQVSNIRTGLRALSRAVNKYSTNVAQSYSQMHSHLVALGQAESSIKCAAAAIERDVGVRCASYAQNAVIDSAIAKCEQNIAQNIRTVVAAVESAAVTPNWTRNRNRIECNGIAIAVSARGAARVIVSHALVGEADFASALTLGADYINGCLEIPICDITMELVKKIVTFGGDAPT